MKKLTLETTQPFQGLPEIVAYDEGLFEREGLGIEWADRDKGAKHERVATNIVTPKGLDPFLSQIVESRQQRREAGKLVAAP